MAVTLTVFYGDFLKRGPGCPNATFGQWIVLQDHGILGQVRRLESLRIQQQNGNSYVVSPITLPLNPASTHVRIQVTTVGEPNKRGAHPGSVEVSIVDGGKAEVWV